MKVRRCNVLNCFMYKLMCTIGCGKDSVLVSKPKLALILTKALFSDACLLNTNLVERGNYSLAYNVCSLCCLERGRM